MTRPRRLILTGASSGIGAALAQEYAPGSAMLLVGRDADRLNEVCDSVRRAGGEATPLVADVRETERLGAAIRAFDAEAPVDLVIANAGITCGLGPDGAPEAPGESRRLMDVNYGGMLATVEPLLPAMIARGRGHIVLLSSLAGLRALPDMPSYSATKAAVSAYGVSLRGWLGPKGITTSVIYPGFVTSPMSARHIGYKPFEISAKAAARLIRRRLDRKATRIAFPTLLALGIALDRLLPPALGDWFMKPYTAFVKPDGEL